VKTRHESVPTRAACRGSSPRIHPKSRETAGLSGCTASHAEVGAVFAAEVFTPRPTPTMCHAPARLPRGHVHDVHRGTERERLGHEVAPTSLPPVPATQHTRCLPRVGPSGQPSGSRVQWNTPFLCLHRICSLFPIVIICLASRDTTCRPSYSPSPAMVYFSFAKTHQSMWRRRERRGSKGVLRLVGIILDRVRTPSASCAASRRCYGEARGAYTNDDAHNRRDGDNACCPATAIVDEQLVCAMIGREMEGCSRKGKLFV
jgi:hypothetical protein